MTAADFESQRVILAGIVEGGGIYVNNRRVEDLDRSLGTDDLLQGRFIVLRKGRRDYHLLRVE